MTRWRAALAAAGCEPISSEKISTRVKVRPEFAKAMEYVRTIKSAVPHQRVIFTVHEMKRLGRGAAELLTIAEELRRADIQLELLTGPLQGVYDPSRHGAALFAFFAGMAESEREYIREKSLEGQASARERGRHGGRPRVFDDDMVAYARSLRERGVPVPEIASRLVISTGKNKGRHPSLSSVYRVLANDGPGA
ncbi:recombinase family protein [Nonomuraea sp. NPDC049637]|uniref:recombinase family protein n=1 Tax=Nonomuraea sp. NPDC049637 TaxID=3154356 RepID=UPI00344297A5